MEFSDPQFWLAALQIVAIDLVLGGDNAVIIALACRRLPEKQRNLGIFWGVFGAIAIRIILVFFAINLLALPYLKLVGAILLVWIGIKLLLPEPSETTHEVNAGVSLMGAIKTIIIADAVMSLDNVIGIAGAARGDLTLVIFGLLVSVPIIVWGSKLVMKLMNRFPIVIFIGAGLLGWIAGTMAITDSVTIDWVNAHAAFLHWVMPVGMALTVILAGKWLTARAQKREIALVDLTDDTPKK